jgi:hypothetical protein
MSTISALIGYCNIDIAELLMEESQGLNYLGIIIIIVRKNGIMRSLHRILMKFQHTPTDEFTQ